MGCIIGGLHKGSVVGAALGALKGAVAGVVLGGATGGVANQIEWKRKKDDEEWRERDRERRTRYSTVVWNGMPTARLVAFAKVKEDAPYYGLTPFSFSVGTRTTQKASRLPPT